MNGNPTLLPVKALLSQSWQMLKSKAKVLYSIHAVLALIAILMVVSVLAGIVSGYFTGGETANSATLATTLVLVILAIIFSVWVQVALIESVVHGYGFKQAFGEAKSKIWSYFGTELLVGIFCIVGFILLIIPGVLFVVWYMFAGLIVVTEGLSGIEALKQSKSYVKGRFWSVFWRIFAPWVGICIILLIIQLIADIFLGEKEINMISNIITFLIVPFITIYQYLLYKNLKETMHSAPVAVPLPPSPAI